MKKFMFILMVALASGFSKSAAQNTLVATLSHGDEITMFYGITAFAQAYNAAVNGDVINLSGGSFNPVNNITKGISVRGTGTNATMPTCFSTERDCYINVPDSISNKLSFEGCVFRCGIYIQGATTDAYFMKNSFYRVSVGGNAKHAMFINCKLTRQNNAGLSYTGNSSITCINCYIYGPSSDKTDNATADFINCVIEPYDGCKPGSIHRAMLVNSLIMQSYMPSSYVAGSSLPSYKLPNTSTVYNCVAFGEGAGGIFEYVTNISKSSTVSSNNIFINSNPMNDLTDDAKAKYLGNDGTPVGMYGGVFPYNMTPTYPQITKMNVANKTTADGKLSVEIEVSAME